MYHFLTIVCKHRYCSLLTQLLFLSLSLSHRYHLIFFLTFLSPFYPYIHILSLSSDAHSLHTLSYIYRLRTLGQVSDQYATLRTTQKLNRLDAQHASNLVQDRQAASTAFSYLHKPLVSSGSQAWTASRHSSGTPSTGSQISGAGARFSSKIRGRPRVRGLIRRGIHRRNDRVRDPRRCRCIDGKAAWSEACRRSENGSSILCYPTRRAPRA